jgi:adenylosuccinate synthase
MKRTFHLTPSGALKGKELLVGAGVVVDPLVLAEELSLLPAEVRRRLTVDDRCSLVSPLDKDFDGLLENLRGQSAIGTTRRGVGPSYATRALRLSPRVSDLVAGFDFGPLMKFYQKLSLDTAGLLAWAEDSRRLLEELVGDVGGRILEISSKGGSVLFEGSQGTLLDLLHGSYPFVTGTHTTASYIPSALGIPPSLAGEPLGVLKCYTTRVGGGPFPTELKDPLGDRIRALGNEYGATTGRPRRVGWLDLVALKYAIGLNGSKNVAVSKLDVLSQVRDFKACVAYRHDGTETTDFQSVRGQLQEAEPVYESPFSLNGARFEGGLSREAAKFVEFLEERLRVHVTLVSHGEERSMTVEL